MLQWLLEREPAIRIIETGNAGANAHMIAINELLGFTVSGASREWELQLDGDENPAGPAPAQS